MTPFSTPELIVLDTLRVLLTLIGFALVGAYLTLRWPDTGSRHEKARVIGMTLALFVLASSRAVNLGAPLAWQMPASAVVFVLVGYSVLRPARLLRRRRSIR